MISATIMPITIPAMEPPSKPDAELPTISLGSTGTAVVDAAICDEVQL